jgi:hypothetical protein
MAQAIAVIDAGQLGPALDMPDLADRLLAAGGVGLITRMELTVDQHVERWEDIG